MICVSWDLLNSSPERLKSTQVVDQLSSLPAAAAQHALAGADGQYAADAERSALQQQIHALEEHVIDLSARLRACEDRAAHPTSNSSERRSLEEAGESGDGSAADESDDGSLCPETCFGSSCEGWVTSTDNTCAQMESRGCDCSGCDSCSSDGYGYGYGYGYGTGDGDGDGACLHTDDGATDPYGDTCEYYASTPSDCGGYDDSDFSSLDMCCACGGGGTCLDTDDGATDPYGDTCEYYASTPSDCGGYDDSDFSSQEMCCACEGGSIPTWTPTPTVTPTVSNNPTTSPAPTLSGDYDVSDLDELNNALGSAPSDGRQWRITLTKDIQVSQGFELKPGTNLKLTGDSALARRARISPEQPGTAGTSFGSCAATCYGYTCEYWNQYESVSYSCLYLEDYGCDCGGCECVNDSPFLYGPITLVSGGASSSLPVARILFY